MIRHRGPLAGSYPAAVALVVFALVPFLMLTAAVFPLAPLLSKSLHLSTAALDVTIGMSDAAYAFGTVLAVQFAVHLPQRRMLLGYVSAFLIAAVLAAWAPSGPVFVGSFIAEGLCTSLMLIAAVPPLVTGWPTAKMPWTGAIMNLCIFGAVALGPTLGGLQAASGTWRPLFWVVAGVAALALLYSVLTFEDQPAQDRGAPWDFVALVLAGGGCASAFYGGRGAASRRLARARFAGPAAGGGGDDRGTGGPPVPRQAPLMPVRQLVTAAVLTAVLFGVLFRTRFTPVLAISGLGMLAVAAALLTGLAIGGGVTVAVGSALIGFGVGASVSPALFLAGLSLRSAQIQRVFALIELLRGVTAFLVAPILLYLATAIGSGLVAGTRAATWICLAIAAGGGLTAVAVFARSGGRLQTPNLERWAEGEPAWHSPPVRRRARSIPGPLLAQHSERARR